MRESVATEHAVGDDFCRGTVEVWRRFAVLDVLPQQADGGELDGLRHKIGVQIDRAKGFVELAQLDRPNRPNRPSESPGRVINVLVQLCCASSLSALLFC